MTGGVLRGGRYDLRDATMLDLITTAYGVDADSVLGGPSWLEVTRFDVVDVPFGALAPDALKKMLQGLGPAPNTKDPREMTGLPSRSFNCQNMTMAEFANQLPGIAPGYLRLPVADGTGLQGSWNFTFAFSSVLQLRLLVEAEARIHRLTTCRLRQIRAVR